jgi:UDP-sulfoquinovose synthase
MQKILVLGADGYCGWATTLYLSKFGYRVVAVDNYVRRQHWDHYKLTHYKEDIPGQGNKPLYEVKPAHERLQVWQKRSGKDVPFLHVDLSDFHAVMTMISEQRPDAIVHFAEQRSAPFSFLSPQHALETIQNNTFSTYNLLEAIARVNPDIHLIKLGTMGEYGYTPHKDIIPEGEIDFPKRPNSPYHMTKCMDSIALEMMRRIYKLRVTDLHQGVVYGIQTDETGLDRELFNRFDYDGIWGTVINRFCIQVLLGQPLSVYGAGGQSRGIISIKDAIQCVEISIRNPPEPGEMEVRNQITEIMTVNQMAAAVVKAAEKLGIKAAVDHVYNPRLENENHDLKVSFGKFVTLGLKGNLLSDTLLNTELRFLSEFKSHIDADLLNNQHLGNWRKKGVA